MNVKSLLWNDLSELQSFADSVGECVIVTVRGKVVTLNNWNSKDGEIRNAVWPSYFNYSPDWDKLNWFVKYRC